MKSVQAHVRNTNTAGVLALLLVLGACSTTATTGGETPDAGDQASSSSSGGGGASSSSSSSSGGASMAFPAVPVDALHIQPRDGSAFLVTAIGAATASVDLASYILTDNSVEQALGNAVGRGVTVRVMLDPDQTVNNSARTYLMGRGVQVRSGPAGFTNFHQKTVMVDAARAYIMTLNPSASAFTSNREYAVLVTRAAEVTELKTLFDADWAGQTNPRVDSNLMVSPNNSRLRLITLINRATTKLLVQVETFSDEGMRSLLKQKLDAGVDVRILMAHPTDVDQNAADALTLRNRGFPVRFLRAPTMHAKMVVVDGALAYVGSINFTRPSMDQNREIGVLLDDAPTAAALDTQAEADWAAGVVN